MVNDKFTLVLVHDYEENKDYSRILRIDESWLKENSNSVNAETASYFASPDEILKKSRDLEDYLIDKLSTILNYHHNINFSKQGWKIILGHWIRMHSQMFSRYFILLERASQYHEVEKIVVAENYIQAPLDTSACVHYFEDPRVSEYFALEISKEIFNSAQFISVGSKLDHFLTKKNKNYNATINEKIESKIRLQLQKASRFFSKNSDALIVNTYLPFGLEFRLNFLLRQWPRMGISPLNTDQFHSQKNLELRKKLFQAEEELPLELKLGLMSVQQTMPLSYLENFQEIYCQSEKSELPSNPKFIFTSNNFFGDEIFKIYTASKIDLGIPYFVGQHGNNYGTLLTSSPTVEEETSTSFFSWGWETNKAKPLFIIKNPKPKVRKTSNNLTDSLLILGHRGFRTEIIDVQKEWNENSQYQIDFLEAIKQEIKESVILRMHPQALNYGQNLVLSHVSEQQIKEISFGNSSIKKYWNRSRVVIHAYDSTGILETLSQNIPTIAFWHRDSSPKTEDAEKYYSLLAKVGIIHYNGLSAAKHLNQIYEDVDSWWLNKDVQAARNEFCTKYAHTVTRPLKELMTEFSQKFSTS